MRFNDPWVPWVPSPGRAWWMRSRGLSWSSWGHGAMGPWGIGNERQRQRQVFFDLGGDIHGTLPRQMLKRQPMAGLPDFGCHMACHNGFHDHLNHLSPPTKISLQSLDHFVSIDVKHILHMHTMKQGVICLLSKNGTCGGMNAVSSRIRL